MLMELPSWFKAGFSQIFREFFPHEMKKIILSEVRFKSCEVRLNIGKLKKLNILSLLIFSSILGEKDNLS